MKLKFDANLDYQLDAVKAVVDLFDGQPMKQGDFEISFADTIGMLEQTELGIGNRLILDDEALLRNVHSIQERNDIERTPVLQGNHFSVEMETGL